MKEPSPYKCDYCGARKGETNHWFQRITGTELGTFLLIPWDDWNPDEPGIEHICSEKCAHTALSQYLARQGKP